MHIWSPTMPSILKYLCISLVGNVSQCTSTIKCSCMAILPSNVSRFLWNTCNTIYALFGFSFIATTLYNTRFKLKYSRPRHVIHLSYNSFIHTNMGVFTHLIDAIDSHSFTTPIHHRISLWLAQSHPPTQSRMTRQFHIATRFST